MSKYEVVNEVKVVEPIMAEPCDETAEAEALRLDCESAYNVETSDEVTGESVSHPVLDLVEKLVKVKARMQSGYPPESEDIEVLCDMCLHLVNSEIS